jgi:hypothetical protein
MLAKHEFGQGVEHFKAAATHAARGTGATVGPKINSAKGRVQPAVGRARDVASSSWGSTVATLAPLAAAATEGARLAGRKADKETSKNVKKLDKSAKRLDRTARKALAQKKSKSGKGRLLGITLAGLAVGAAGAAVLRRKQRQQWDEYDPSRPIASGATATGPVGTETIPSATTLGTTAGGGDQTSSTQHSPTVARMAGGDSPAV